LRVARVTARGSVRLAPTTDVLTGKGNRMEAFESFDVDGVATVTR
jgi:hypothetical protein